MKMVYLIEEENHGMIGIAKDYSSVIDFLIDSNWLDENFEVYDESGNFKTIKEDFSGNWKDNLLAWNIEKFNNYFDGCFYLTIEEVYGA